jgi:hypothetical protein
MTFNAVDYHPSWPDIRRQILDQAGNCCEWCRVPNGSFGARDRHGEWHTEDDIESMNSDVGYALFDGEYPRIIRIVLTTAHACQNTACIDPGHLFALCQRCHLNHDREHHLEVQAARRRRRRLETTGQLELAGGAL